MGAFKKLSEEVQKHLRQIAAMQERDQSDSFLDTMAEAWLQKERIFMQQVDSFRMSIESAIEPDEKRAYLILTYSGSILGVGPVDRRKRRNIIYASIGLRKDVPEKLIEESLKVTGEVRLDREIHFEGGSLKKCSPVYKIALMSDYTGIGDQTRQIEDATRIMTKEFVSINNTVIPD